MDNKEVVGVYHGLSCIDPRALHSFFNTGDQETQMSHSVQRMRDEMEGSSVITFSFLLGGRVYGQTITTRVSHLQKLLNSPYIKQFLLCHCMCPSRGQRHKILEGNLRNILRGHTNIVLTVLLQEEM